MTRLQQYQRDLREIRTLRAARERATMTGNVLATRATCVDTTPTTGVCDPADAREAQGPDFRAIRTQRKLHRIESTLGSHASPREAIEARSYARRAQERGKRNEERLLAIVRASRSTISWIFGARTATADEDARGIDVVVETDVGDLWLQSKSSREGIRKFIAKRARLGRFEPIACVLVKDDDELLTTRVRWALGMLRERDLKTEERRVA